jgi:hypothetical protein
MAIAVPLRIAIWNWIHLFPSEYADVIRSKGRMEGSPERVFDLLHSMNQTGVERTFWPILTALHCITSERLTSDLQLEHFGYASVAGQKNASRKVRTSHPVLSCILHDNFFFTGISYCRGCHQTC